MSQYRLAASPRLFIRAPYLDCSQAEHDDCLIDPTGRAQGEANRQFRGQGGDEVFQFAEDELSFVVDPL